MVSITLLHDYLKEYMLGLLRTILALMVMTYHLFYHKDPLGMYPVFGFYTISGYLMTLIMQESYGYTFRGRYSFLINRSLRLYPQYWAAAIISIFFIYFLGDDLVRKYHQAIFMPNTAFEYFENIFMSFIAWNPHFVTPRLVPPTWALTIEIFFYLLICAGISKTFKRVKIWLSMSILYVIGTFVFELSLTDRYLNFASASLPFAVGSGIYFLSKSEKVYSAYQRLGISSKYVFLLIMTNCLLFTQIAMDAAIANLGFYLNLGLFTLLVYGMTKGQKIIDINNHLDKKIGDFSYPIYLLHWQTGLFVSYLSHILFGKIFIGFSYQSFPALIASVIIIFFLSLSFITILDKPIEAIRSRIKTTKS